MAKDESSVAPDEMVNIRLPGPADGGEGEELPFRMALIGDYTGKEDKTPIGERPLYSINQKNFNDIMSKMDISTSFSVANKISGAKDEEIPIDLKFKKISDFRPESVAAQVPQLAALVELRKRLKTLRSEASKDPAMLKELNKLLTEVFPSLGGDK